MDKEERKAKRLIEEFQDYVYGVLEQNSNARKYSKSDVLDIMKNACSYLDLETWRFSKKFQNSLIK